MAMPGQAGIRRGREVTGRHNAVERRRDGTPLQGVNALGLIRPEGLPI